MRIFDDVQMNKRDFNLTKKLIKKHFSKQKKSQLSNIKVKIPIAAPPYDWQEVCEALDSMIKMKTTMGEKVKKFENLFSKYIGVKHAIMVNSGSSANLIALSVLSNPFLKNQRIKPNDEIITPAVTWSTIL